MGFTVKALLSMSELPDLKLVSGAKSVNNLIRNACITDCPDAFDWMQPGDLILTSGYMLKDDPELQVRFVRELSETACAGIGIKVPKYWDEVPQRMIDESNRRSLPIFTIPLHNTLNEIQTIVFHEVNENQDTLLQKYFKIHQRLMACSLSEQTLDNIVKTTVELINNPLIVVDKNWNFLSCADRDDNKIPLAKVLPLVKGKPAFDRSFLDAIPKDIEDFKKAVKRTCITPYGPVICRIHPVRADTTVYGYLIAWESVRKLRSVECMGLEQAAIIIALERIKTMRIEESRRIMRQDFFTDLLEGHIESTALAYSLAEMNGLSADKRYFCAVMRTEKFRGKTEQDSRSDIVGLDRVQRKLVKLCEEFFAYSHVGACVFSRSNNIIMLVQIGDGCELSNLKHQYGDMFTTLCSVITSQKDCPVISIGVGCGCSDITELKKSFVEAQEAIRLAGIAGNDGSISWFEDLMIYNILNSGVPGGVLREFYDSSIGPLAEYDRENKTELLESLEIYLLENRSISAAAARLYIHRNTMNYRINKIKQILSVDFDDSENLLKLQLGIKIMRVLKGLGMK